MKKLFHPTIVVAALAIFFLMPCRAFAQTSAFTYQGKLISGNAPANGLFDIRFTAYNASTNGLPIGGGVTRGAVAVSGGLFTTTVDFGTNTFTGGDVWLELAVSPASSNTFITLSPRQQVTPAPYALYAADSSGGAGASTNGLHALLVDSNGVIASPPNFFAANSNTLGSVLGGLPSANTTNAGLLSPNDFVSIRYKPSDYYTGPPMCVNSWPDDGNNQGTEFGAGFPVGFSQHVTELCNSGLRNLGFDTVVIDGGWYGYRDPLTGQLHENAQEWPDGLSNCVRWAHSLGIKVGIWHSVGLSAEVGYGAQQGWVPQYTYYSTNSAGVVATNYQWFGNTNMLSQLFPPGFSNDQLLVSDATWFAQIGIDYVKLEMGTNDVFTDAQEASSVRLFSQAMLNNGRRPYIMSAVGTGRNQPWMTGLINAERFGGFDMPNYTTGIRCWNQFTNNFFWAAQHPEQSGPGNYISTDIIPDDYSYDNFRVGGMLVMAAMLSSELSVAGTNVPAAFNENIIAVDQDPAALMARAISTNGGMTVWRKPLTSPMSDTFAVMFLNIDTNPATFTVTNLSTLGSTNAQMYCLDLISNVVTLVGANWTVTVPGKMAYGYKMSAIHTGY